jgi:hypothetical protein
LVLGRKAVMMSEFISVWFSVLKKRWLSIPSMPWRVRTAAAADPAKRVFLHYDNQESRPIHWGIVKGKIVISFLTTKQIKFFLVQFYLIIKLNEDLIVICFGCLLQGHWLPSISVPNIAALKISWFQKSLEKSMASQRSCVNPWLTSQKLHP